MSDVLKVEGLKAYYQINAYGLDRDIRAVDDITLAVRENEVYGIAGESSSGKTSLIKVLAAAIRPPLKVVGGSVNYHFRGLDIDPYKATKAEVDAIRWSRLSYIMQGSMSVLNPVRKIGKIFEDFAFRPMGLPKGAYDRAVAEHLERLRLPLSVLKSYPHELSGGMRQRVTIALATVCKPQFIIADEPTTALDVVVQKDVLSMLKELQRDMAASVIFVTHDMSVHANMADRIGIVYAGRLVEEGPVATLFHAPRHPYTAHLVASLPRIGDRTQRPHLPGRPPSLAEPPTGCRFHPRCPLATDRCKVEVPPMEARGPDHRSACFHADQVKPLLPESVTS